MMRAATTRVAPRLVSFSHTMALATIALGLVVLYGWVIESPALKSVAPGLVTMKPNAAFAITLLGLSLRALHDPETSTERRGRGRWAARLAIAIGALTLVEYISGWSLGIDELVFRDSDNLAPTAPPGRMAPTTAIDLIALGLALLWLDVPGRHVYVEIASLLVLFVSLSAVLAYLYALELLHGTGNYTHMAVHETAAFCALACGIVAARPHQGLMAVVSSPRVSGLMARSLLPAAAAIPVLLGWLGFAGLRAGFYHSLFALASVTVAIALGMSALILWCARSLDELDRERERSYEERRRAEEAARKSAERFHSLVDGVRDYAMLLVDARGFVQTWNPGADRVFGYRDADVIGRPHSILYARDDIQRRKPEQDLQRAAEEGGLDEDSPRVRKDGTQFWAHVTTTPLAADDGRLRGFVHVARDITAEKQAAEDLESEKAAGASREQALQQALASLARTHDELKNAQLGVLQNEKMESIGRLAAGVAHEVKNPLAVIQSGIDYLSTGVNANGASAEVLDEMQKAVARATAILGGLVDFSAPRTLELEVMDLNRVIVEALRHVKHEIDRSGVEVAMSLDERLPELPVDRLKMEQVFVNILLNAVQAMPNGGTLSIQSYNARTRTELVSAGSRTSPLLHPRERAIVVEISDTGSGIPADHLRKIFEPFFTTKPTRKGTGLGLTLSKTIVDMHGGSVNVTNRKEGGVRVTVRLSTKGSRDGQAAASAD
jgi:PAS domain S-box-containing protein